MKDAVNPQGDALFSILSKNEAEILAEWIEEQAKSITRRDQAHQAEARTTSRDFLGAMVEAMREGNSVDMRGAAWGRVRDMLSEISTARALQGYSPVETATFVLSLKKPLFSRLRTEFNRDG